MKTRSIMWGVISIAAGVILGIATLVVLGAGGWGFGSGGFHSGDEAMTGTMERHFLEEMIPHHEDAVAMAKLALTRAEHPELRQLAETIIADQTREIEQMRGWYRAWYGVEAPTYGEGGRDDLRGRMMGGMMHEETDLAALEAAPVFDKEFIEQMIPHHQMAVMMARMLLSRSGRPEMDTLAEAIIQTQTAEIEQMADWYETWYE